MHPRPQPQVSENDSGRNIFLGSIPRPSIIESSRRAFSRLFSCGPGSTTGRSAHVLDEQLEIFDHRSQSAESKNEMVVNQEESAVAATASETQSPYKNMPTMAQSSRKSSPETKAQDTTADPQELDVQYSDDAPSAAFA